jgi:hypothetical protein
MLLALSQNAAPTRQPRAPGQCHRLGLCVMYNGGHGPRGSFGYKLHRLEFSGIGCLDLQQFAQTYVQWQCLSQCSGQAWPWCRECVAIGIAHLCHTCAIHTSAICVRTATCSTPGAFCCLSILRMSCSTASCTIESNKRTPTPHERLACAISCCAASLCNSDAVDDVLTCTMVLAPNTTSAIAA